MTFCALRVLYQATIGSTKCDLKNIAKVTTIKRVVVVLDRNRRFVQRSLMQEVVQQGIGAALPYR